MAKDSDAAAEEYDDGGQEPTKTATHGDADHGDHNEVVRDEGQATATATVVRGAGS